MEPLDSPIGVLPNETLNEIFLYLKPYPAILVCSRWYTVSVYTHRDIIATYRYITHHGETVKKMLRIAKNQKSTQKIEKLLLELNQSNRLHSVRIRHFRKSTRSDIYFDVGRTHHRYKITIYKTTNYFAVANILPVFEYTYERSSNGFATFIYEFHTYIRNNEALGYELMNKIGLLIKTVKKLILKQ